jgi:PhoH-like ATPase
MMMSERKRIYVLDTNVLMHDPTALFRFEEHDVFMPMTVLEELDNGKKGTSEVARNARQVSRFINELIEAHGAERIERGLKLVRPKGLNLRRESQIGRLLFQTSAGDPAKSRMKVMPDNQILAAIVALHQQHPQTDVVLVSKDINLRIKASIFGVPRRTTRMTARSMTSACSTPGTRRCRPTSGASTPRTCARGRKKGTPSTN